MGAEVFVNIFCFFTYIQAYFVWFYNSKVECSTVAEIDMIMSELSVDSSRSRH